MERPRPIRDLGTLRAEAGTVVALLALAAVYLATTLPHLADDPIVGGDEGWIISASARLAEDGVFGSGLFRGFYGAEDHYYFNLPLHHLVLAAAFKLIGIGIGEARLVSVGFGLAALLLTYALGRRLGGPVVGVGAAALLVLLRLNLAPFSGLTLTDLGATVRYDLPAASFGLAALLLLARRLDAPPSPMRVAGAGLLIGLGSLTQFVGAFFALPVGLFLLTLAWPLGRRLALIGVLVLAGLAPFLPYGAYLLSDWEDFRGQSRSVEQRTDLLSPGFYWDGLRNEPDRYAISTALHDLPDSADEALRRPSARLTMLLVAPLAAAYVLRRGRRDPAYRLLGFGLVALVVQLALFESTKRFVYWVVVVPPLCVAIADSASAAWRWRPRRERARWLARGAVAVVLAVFAVEGVAVAAKDVRDAGDAASYAALGTRLDAALPAGASAIGDNRISPALRHRDYRSLLLLFYHTNPRISRERTTDVFGAMERTGADYVLLSPLSREILAKLSPKDAADFERFLSTRAELVVTVRDEAYGPIEVYRVRD